MYLYISMNGKYYDLNCFPVASSGRMRSVYLLPDNPKLILKTISRERLGDDGHIVSQKRFKHWRPVGRYLVFNREVHEYFRLKNRTFFEPETNLPIPTIYGFADTSNGLGMLIEKVSDQNGGLAPTMYGLAKTGALETKHRQAFAEFEAKCRNVQLILGDANPGNFVFTETRSGEPEWVCVDGFGVRTLIPVNLYSKWANGRALSKRFTWLNAYLDRHIQSSNRLTTGASTHPTKNPAITRRA